MDACRLLYPFTAIVGQSDMKAALCLNAVQPGIGGVLITGERGTAKTTAVRALAGLIGNKRVVELPLNASEDRVVGTLRIDELMKDGARVLEPGILAEADGGILYVDEVNLLEDHIVDLLLDAAATGVCRVEREGASEEYPARFVLVGTMNPEEGALRPQLLDRFGLSVRVDGSLSREERLELLKRHIEFEADPVAFCARFAESERLLAQRIAEAARLYPQVAYPDEAAELAAGICEEVGVDGYRADIAIMRAARAAAAFDGRDAVEREDVVTAARFALPHRMKHLPFEETELTESMLTRAVASCEGKPDDSSEEEEGRPLAPSAAAIEPDADSFAEADAAEPEDEGGAALKEIRG